MIEFCHCLNAGNNHQILVAYLDRNWQLHHALIDHRDGCGVDRDTNRRVHLSWQQSDPPHWIERRLA